MHDLLKGREYNRNKAMEGFDEVNDPCIARAVHQGGYADVLLRPTMVGILRCGKMLPPQLKALRRDPDGYWVVSTQSTRCRNWTEVETLLRQRTRGLRSVSFAPVEHARRLPLQHRFMALYMCSARRRPRSTRCGAPSAPDRSCPLVALRAPRAWGRCATRRTLAPRRCRGASSRRGTQSGLSSKALGSTSFLAVQLKTKQTLPPIHEWRRFEPRTCSRAVLVREPVQGEAAAHGRRQSPKVAISSRRSTGLRLRRGTRIQELPEEHEVLRRWCEALNQEYRGQRLAGLAHEIFLKLLKASGKCPARWRGRRPWPRGRQARAVRLRADGHLRAGPRGAGEAGLCGQRATLQRPEPQAASSGF